MQLCFGLVFRIWNTKIQCHRALKLQFATFCTPLTLNPPHWIFLVSWTNKKTFKWTEVIMLTLVDTVSSKIILGYHNFYISTMVINYNSFSQFLTSSVIQSRYVLYIYFQLPSRVRKPAFLPTRQHKSNTNTNSVHVHDEIRVPVRAPGLISPSFSAQPSLLWRSLTWSWKRDWQLFNEGLCTFDYPALLMNSMSVLPY